LRFHKQYREDVIASICRVFEMASAIQIGLEIFGIMGRGYFQKILRFWYNRWLPGWGCNYQEGGWTDWFPRYIA